MSWIDNKTETTRTDARSAVAAKSLEPTYGNVGGRRHVARS